MTETKKPRTSAISDGASGSTNPLQRIEAPAQLISARLYDIQFSKTNELFRDPTEFTPAALQDLADSIERNTLAQPILVRPAPTAGKYILVAGERRLRAFLLLQKTRGTRFDNIPAYVRDLDEATALELQIIENLQRENLNPIKEANGFFALTTSHKHTTSSIAARIGKSIDYVQERLRLAQLIPKAQQMIVDGYMPLKAGLKLARVPSKKQQEECLAFCSEEFDTIGTQHSATKFNAKQHSKFVFKGLDKMQEWLDDHLFTDLQRADFNKEDTTLNPTMGGCGSCRNRTKNTQGLFDDMIVDDKCLLPSCYRIKQLATYKRLRDDLKKRYPKARIIFKRRDNSIDGRGVFDKELAALGEIVGAGSGEIIAEKEGSKMKRPTIAILIGISQKHFAETKNDAKGWTYWKPTARKPMRGGSLKATANGYEKVTPENIAKLERQKADDDRKAAITAELVVDLELDAILKNMDAEKLLDLQLLTVFDDIDNDAAANFPRILQRLGIDWKRDGKAVKAKGFDTIAARLDDNDTGLEGDEILEALEQATTAQKRAALVMGMLTGYYYIASEARTAFKLPSYAACKQKVSGKAGELFKKWKEANPWQDPKKTNELEKAGKGLAVLLDKKKGGAKK